MEETQQNKVQFREVTFLAPEPLIQWLEDQANINGIDGDQFLNALLYAVWGNYNENLKFQNNGKKELQSS